jgi:hypothetical protein
MARNVHGTCSTTWWNQGIDLLCHSRNSQLAKNLASRASRRHGTGRLIVKVFDVKDVDDNRLKSSENLKPSLPLANVTVLIVWQPASPRD